MENIIFRKIAVKIFAIGLFLLIGSNVKAEENWAGFKSQIEDPYIINIDVSFFTGDNHTLNWGEKLASGAVMHYLNSNPAWETTIFEGLGQTTDGGLSITGTKQVNFNANFTFKRFRNDVRTGTEMGVIDVRDDAIVNFSDKTILFEDNINYNDNYGGVIPYGGVISNIGSEGSRASAGIGFYGTSVTFIFNQATNSGGAIFIESYAKAIFRDYSKAFFEGNQATHEGGAVFIQNNSSLLFIDSKANFNNNRTLNEGGAIFVADSLLSFTNTDVSFTGNKADNQDTDNRGGAIFIADYGTATFTNSSEALFENNSANIQGGAIFIDRSNLTFMDSKADFKNNSSDEGSAIYVGDHSLLSFENTDVSFTGNISGAALHVKNSEVNISGNMVFSANSGGDIVLEDGSSINFNPANRTINFNGKIDAVGDDNQIIKSGRGAVVFSTVSAFDLGVDFHIKEGAAHFGLSSNTFNNLEVSSTGILGISIDFSTDSTNPNSYFEVNKLTIERGGSLFVNTKNGSYDVIGETVTFIHTVEEPTTLTKGAITLGGEYGYELQWKPDPLNPTQYYGSLILRSYTPHQPHPLSHVLISPVFAANAIRQSAISDNSPIYSNVKEKAWASAQINGGNLADDDLGDFENSAYGLKAGLRVFNDQERSAGVFAGFASRSYEQDSNKATVSDVDFGVYGSWFEVSPNINLAGFFGYGVQNVKANNGSYDVTFDATVIKFGANAEYDAGLISPFIGFEGARVNTDDIDLGGATLYGKSYMRLSSQIGAKIVRQAGELSWHGKAYIDLLLAGKKPHYSVKPYYENDEAKTAAAKSLNIDATEEGAASFGLGLGVSLPVSKAVDMFAAFDIKLNSDFFGHQSNIGAKFKF